MENETKTETQTERAIRRAARKVLSEAAWAAVAEYERTLFAHRARPTKANAAAHREASRLLTIANDALAAFDAR